MHCPVLYAIHVCNNQMHAFHHRLQVTAKVRRRLGRDKVIGTGSIQVQHALAHSRHMQSVPLVDPQGNTVGKVR